MLTHLQDNPCEENLIKVFDSIIKRFVELKEYEHFEVPELDALIKKYRDVIQILIVLGLPK
jgi:hypothetical protein